MAYSYDSDGNLQTRNVSIGNVTTHWTYSWDVPGRLLKAGNDTGVQGYYAYDGLGRRVEAKEGSSVTFYSYRGPETLSDQFTSGTSNDYVYADGLRIARTGIYVPTYYYHTDAVGSTRLVTDANRNIAFSDNYQPFGQDNSSSGSETYKFTGKPVSQTTGLYYDYQRWYDPSVGRFISEDPLAGHLSNPQSLNPYVYVQDSPSSSVDPTGMADCSSNPGTWLGCVENGGEAAWNGVTTGLSVSAAWWNGQPAWAKYTEIGVGVGAAVVLTAGLAAPELLVLVPPLLVGDVGFGGGVAGVCEEDPEACAPPLPPPSGPGESSSNYGDLTIGDYTLSGGARASFEKGEAYPASIISGYQYGSYPGYATRWATPTLYSNPAQASAELSLPEWNNALFMREVTAPTNEVVWVGKAAAIPYQPGTGGGIQFLVSSSSVFTGGPWIPTVSALLRLPLPT